MTSRRWTGAALVELVAFGDCDLLSDSAPLNKEEDGFDEDPAAADSLGFSLGDDASIDHPAAELVTDSGNEKGLKEAFEFEEAKVGEEGAE